MTVIHRAIFTISKPPLEQQTVWRILAHVKKTLADVSQQQQETHVRLVDFKVPYTTYYGVGSYMDQVQVSLRTETLEEEHLVTRFLQNGLPPLDGLSFHIKTVTATADTTACTVSGG